MSQSPPLDLDKRIISYSGAIRRCTLLFSIFWGLVAAGVVLTRMGGNDDAVAWAATTFGLVSVPAYVVGLVFYWAISLGRKSTIELDPVSNSFGHPICFWGGLFWDEEKISDIERVVGDNEEASRFDANFLCVYGNFGRIKLPFYSHDQREAAREAIRAARTQMVLHAALTKKALEEAQRKREIVQAIRSMEDSTQGIHAPLHDTPRE